MPDDGRQIVRVTNQELQTMRFDEALEHYIPDLATALPDHIPLERFKRVVLTAVNQNPELARADRRSLFNSCSRCAHDGLYPDGREAALVVFRTKVKRKVANDNGDLVEREFYADLVQYLPMVAGIRKRMRNTGEVLSADAQVVCRNDKFHYEFGDDPKIEHHPPPLDAERGDTVGAYAIIKLANGEVLREVMSRQQIERVRQMSRAKDGPAWTKSWDEMSRKTVLKRCAKAAPTGSEIERLLERDEEIPHAHADVPLREIPPRPRPEDYLSISEAETESEIEEQTETDSPRLQVVDDVGEVRGEYATEEEAIEALIALVGEMRSLASLEGLGENNPTLAHFPAVIEAYKDQKEALSNSGNRQDRPEAGAPTTPARGATPSLAPEPATEHPEEQQSSIPTERSNLAGAVPQNTPSDAAPRDEPKPSAAPEALRKLQTVTGYLNLRYWTRHALDACRDPGDIDELSRIGEPSYKNLTLTEYKEIRDLIDARNRELSA
jgi:phage RecT family recombinase